MKLPLQKLWRLAGMLICLLCITGLQAADSGDAGTGVKVHALDPAADGESAGEDTGSGDVANIAGSFHVRLSNKVKKKNMVRLGEGETKLTWGFVDARSVKRQILKSADDAMNAHAGNTDPTAAYEVPHLESRVRYPEAFEGVDIRYTLFVCHAPHNSQNLHRTSP